MNFILSDFTVWQHELGQADGLSCYSFRLLKVHLNLIIIYPNEMEKSDSVSTGESAGQAEADASRQKKLINELIQTESTRLTFKKNDNLNFKSIVWNKFKIVKIDDTPVDFVKCNSCPTVLQWTSRMGTGGMNRHVCPVPNKSKLTSHTEISEKQQTLKRMFPKCKPPTKEVEDLNDTIVIGLAKDLRPLSTVESPGFRSIAQSLVHFGCKFGNVDLDDILHHRTHLKRNNLVKISQDVKMLTRRALESSPSYPYFTYTFDLWTETMKSRHFLSMSVHLVSENFQVGTYLLGVEEFPHDLRKTTGNIREQCKRILAQYFPEEILDTVMTESFAVTDSGSNVIGVFKKRLPCYCHKLNNVLENCFSDKHLSTEELVGVKTTLNALKSLVKYLKHSGLNSKLSTTIKQAVPTRWNSELRMIKSYLKTKNEVAKLLHEEQELGRISMINEKLVEDLVTLLEGFQLATDIFSSETTVTITEIPAQRLTLNASLDRKDNDSLEIDAIKRSLLGSFEKYFTLDEIHYVATLLHPKRKKLKFADESMKGKVHEFVRNWIQRFKEQTPIVVEEEPKPKRKKDIPASCQSMDDSDSEDTDDTVPHDELQKYMDLKWRKECNTASELLQFWKTEGSNFPNLQKLAAFVLAIPASSTADERVFSATGQTMSHRRSELGGKTVSDLTLIHKNYKL